jgi:hypothetical protein
VPQAAVIVFIHIFTQALAAILSHGAQNHTNLILLIQTLQRCLTSCTKGLRSKLPHFTAHCTNSLNLLPAAAAACCCCCSLLLLLLLLQAALPHQKEGASIINTSSVPRSGTALA